MAEEAVTSAAEESEAVQTEEQTPTSTEEAEASATTEGGTEEGEQATEEEHKKDAQSRIQELANKNRELSEKLTAQERQVAELAQKFEAQRQAQNGPGYLDKEEIGKWIAEAELDVETLKAEGRSYEAAKLQRRINKVIDEAEEHERKEAEWKKTATTHEQTQAQQQAALKELDAAADFFRDQKKIPADVWDKGAQQWAEIRKADPLLDRQYAEVWMRQGPIAAIQFAHDHISKAQTAEAEKVKAEKAKKDAAKGGIPGGTQAGGKGIASWDQLMGLGSKQVEAYKKNNPKHYQELLDKHLK